MPAFFLSRRTRAACVCLCALSLAILLPCPAAAQSDQQPSTPQSAAPTATDQVTPATEIHAVVPILTKYCTDCHGGERTEAEIDLKVLQSDPSAKRHTELWERIYGAVDDQQMPPPEAAALPDGERQSLLNALRSRLVAEASARAGDPGPVVLRRLNNAEYTYTVRDLTGITSIDPTREFPVDGAAGEGFTNTGQSLVMSASLITKYLDAAKQVAGHAVLLPDGLRFSPSSSRRDWTDESLTALRDFYRRFTANEGSQPVNVQGIEIDTNQGGRIPLAAYLAATIEARQRGLDDSRSLDDLAQRHGVHATYLSHLWSVLQARDDAAHSGNSLLIDQLRSAWSTASADDIPTLVRLIEQWQQSLWKFNSVGHLGRAGGPTRWMEPVSPVVTAQAIRVPLAAKEPTEAMDVVRVHLQSTCVQGTADSAVVVWESPRLVAPGRPDLLLRDLAATVESLQQRRQLLISHAEPCLRAATELEAIASIDRDGLDRTVVELAQRHGVPRPVLLAWLRYLGLADHRSPELGPPLVRTTESVEGYAFVKGWVGDNALSVLANASEQEVRIPGRLPGRSVAVHPAPDRNVAVAWNSAHTGTVRIEGTVRHAHVECGNGVAWTLRWSRGNTQRILASGTSDRDNIVAVGPIKELRVRPGDAVSLVVHPQDGNHACDLTGIDLSIVDATNGHMWRLADDLADNILSGNPFVSTDAPSSRPKASWLFYSEPTGPSSVSAIPTGSLLDVWRSAESDRRDPLAAQFAELIKRTNEQAIDAPADRELYRQITSLAGPLLLGTLQDPDDAWPKETVHADNLRRSPSALAQDGTLGERTFLASDLQTPISDRTTVVIPADLARNAELVATVRLVAPPELETCVQVRVTTGDPPATDLRPDAPLLVATDSRARQSVETAIREHQQLFPAALCYATIVPVDEAVTLTLFHREDDNLRRLMLTEKDAAELDRLWDELLYVSQEPLLKVNAYEQIVEFATQDRPDLVTAFAPLREPTLARAEAFRDRQRATEPKHLAAVQHLADRAWRRALPANETQELAEFYQTLRAEGQPHEEAIRLTIARVLTSPQFLYRWEQSSPDDTPVAVSDDELASRLSYFLWSSMPDDRLRTLARKGHLSDEATLLAETRRMLADAKTRRLAIEFACQWLHVRDFDQNDEKNEALYPEFAALRGAMYEEVIQFFETMFREQGSVLDLIQADHTFVNNTLAEHYGIPNVEGPAWQRVDGVQAYGRGGVLGMAAVLAKQSGASRTSPILRGNWVSETLLGERLPRPPANVPQLPETLPAGLTARQLIEQHSSVAACARCHRRIDPYGFALEQYDTIGRTRPQAVDTEATLFDGVHVAGLQGLRGYLSNERRDDVTRQFCRKLLGYALGRSVQLSDEPLLAEMQRRLAENHYRFDIAVESIITSSQFRQIGQLPVVNHSETTTQAGNQP